QAVNREKVAGNLKRLCASRVFLDQDVVCAPGSEILQRLRFALDSAVCSRRKLAGHFLRLSSNPILGIKPGESFWIGIGARTKQEAVYQREHAGIETYTDGQRQHHSNGDQLRIPNHPESILQVANQIVQPKQDATSAE